MADCKRSDTDEGDRIGEVTQQRLEHLKESFYEEHCLALFHLVRPLLDHAGQRLFEEDQDQGHAEHDRHDDPCRERIPCQEEHDGDDYGCVEHKPRYAVRVKPHASHIFRPRGVDDVEHHRHHDEQHSESNGNNEYGVEFPEEGKGSHVVDGPHPQCGYNVLESEDASEQESEDRGKDSRCCDDACQRRFLEVVDQGASDQKEEALAHIAEHGSEDEGVRKPHKHGRIHLIVRGQAVHLYKHFKGLEYFRIIQLGRRFPEIGIVVILHDDEDFIVILDLFKEFLHVVFRHPAAEDVIVFFLILHARRKFPDVKVVGKLFQPVHGGY